MFAELVTIIEEGLMKTSRRDFLRLSGIAAITTLPKTTHMHTNMRGARDIRDADSLLELLEYIFASAQQLPSAEGQAITLTKLARLYKSISPMRAIEACDYAFTSAAHADSRLITGLQSQVVATLADLDLTQAVYYLQQILPSQRVPENRLDQSSARSTTALQIATRLLKLNSKKAMQIAVDQIEEPATPTVALALFAHKLSNQHPKQAIGFCKQVIEAFNSRPVTLKKVYDVAQFLPTALFIDKPTFTAEYFKFLCEIEDIEGAKPYDVVVDIENIDGIRLSRNPGLFIGSLMIPHLEEDLVTHWINLEPELGQVQVKPIARGAPQKTTIVIWEPLVTTYIGECKGVILKATVKNFDDLSMVSDRISLFTFSNIADVLFQQEDLRGITVTHSFARTEQRIITLALSVRYMCDSTQAALLLKDLEDKTSRLPNSLSRRLCLLAIASGYGTFNKSKAVQILEELLLPTTDTLDDGLAERVMECLARTDITRAKELCRQIRDHTCHVLLALCVAQVLLNPRPLQQSQFL